MADTNNFVLQCNHKKYKALTLFIRKILYDLVKGCTYHQLQFVDGEMFLIPVTWVRSIGLPKFLGIQGRHMQKLLAVKGGRWFHGWLLSLWSYLENEEISVALFITVSQKAQMQILARFPFHSIVPSMLEWILDAFYCLSDLLSFRLT